MNISFDICKHLHTMTDFGHRHMEDTSVRVYINNAECYAKEDGVPCSRNGRCVIARNGRTWKQVNRKSWSVRMQNESDK